MELVRRQSAPATAQWNALRARHVGDVSLVVPVVAMSESVGFTQSVSGEKTLRLGQSTCTDESLHRQSETSHVFGFRSSVIRLSSRGRRNKFFFNKTKMSTVFCLYGRPSESQLKRSNRRTRITFCVVNC